MSMFYPPMKRARIEPVQELIPEPPQKTYEEEFPSLVSQPAMKVWGGTKSFVELAKNLEIKKKETNFKKEIEKAVEKPTYHTNIPLTQFHMVGHFTDEDSSSEELPAPEKTEEDEWITVCHRKKRKQKSIEEIANRPITPPDEPETNWEQEEFNENTEWGNY